MKKTNTVLIFKFLSNNKFSNVYQNNFDAIAAINDNHQEHDTNRNIGR